MFTRVLLQWRWRGGWYDFGTHEKEHGPRVNSFMEQDLGVLSSVEYKQRGRVAFLAEGDKHVGMIDKCLRNEQARSKTWSSIRSFNFSSNASWQG